MGIAKFMRNLFSSLISSREGGWLSNFHIEPKKLNPMGGGIGIKAGKAERNFLA